VAWFDLATRLWDPHIFVQQGLCNGGRVAWFDLATRFKDRHDFVQQGMQILGKFATRSQKLTDFATRFATFMGVTVEHATR